MKLDKIKIDAVTQELKSCIAELDSGSSTPWNLREFVAAANLQAGEGDLAKVETVDKHVELANSASEYFLSILRGFHKTETELSFGLIQRFVMELQKISQGMNRGKLTKAFCQFPEFENIKSELKLELVEFDVFYVFYRIKNNRIEIVQFVDGDLLAKYPQYRKEYPDQLPAADTIGGQPEKVQVTGAAEKSGGFGMFKIIVAVMVLIVLVFLLTAHF